MRKGELTGDDNSTTSNASAKQKKPQDPLKYLAIEESVKKILHDIYRSQNINTININDGQTRLADLGSTMCDTLKRNLAENKTKSPLVSLAPNLIGLIMSHLSLKDTAKLSLSCYSLWSLHNTHRHLVISKLTQEARKDPMVRYLLDAILFDPAYQTYPVNYAHIYHVLNHTRSFLNSLFRTDPRSAWKFFTLCSSQLIVDMLLPKNMPTIRDMQGRGVMHFITLSGDVTHFKWFFEGFDEPFNPETMDPDRSLTKLAAEGGNVPLLKHLEEKLGYDLSIVFKGDTSASDESLLTYAVKGGHKSTVLFLIQEVGVDPFIGQNLRIIAANFGHWDLFEELPTMIYEKFLLEDLDLTETAYDSLILAKAAARQSNLTLLLTLMKKYQFDPQQFIDDAIIGGHPDIFWHFVDQQWLPLSAVFEGSVTLAHRLTKAGHLDLLQAVLRNNDSQAQPNENGESILHFASAGGHREIFDYLYNRYYLGRELPVDKNGNTVAHTAAKEGHAFFLIYLYRIFPDIFLLKNNNGCTILHEAAHCGDPELLKMIVEEFGIKIDDGDFEGNTVLHILASHAVEKPQNWRSIAALVEIYGVALLDISNKGKNPFTVREKIIQCDAEEYFPAGMFVNESNLEY